MVGKGRKHAAAASSSAGDGMGTSIPASPLRRALLSTLQGAAPVRGGRPPAKPRGTKGTRCIHVGIYVVLMLYAYWYLYTFYYSCWYLCCTKGTRGRGRGRATRSPHHPKLIHLSTGLLGWIRLRWRLHGLRFTSLGSTSLRSTSLRPTRLVSQRLPSRRLRSKAGMRVRPKRPSGIPGLRQVAMLVATRSWVRGLPSTSVVVRGSRSCQRPPSRGGRLGQMGTSKLIYSYLTFCLHVFSNI